MSRARVAKDLGIDANLIGRWVQEAASGNSAFRGSGRLTPQDDKVRSLEQQVKRLSMERDILKKAMAYFVDVPK